MTGVASLSPALSGKRLQLLLETAPGVSRVAVLSNSPHPIRELELIETQSAAASLGVAIQWVEVGGSTDLDSAFEAITAARADAILAFVEEVTFNQRTRIMEFAARSRLPAMYSAREFVDAGGLMSYGPSLPDQFRRVATYVDKILKGARPADLPVEQPTRFELVVNLKTAQGLGLTLPQSILIRATEVLE